MKNSRQRRAAMARQMANLVQQMRNPSTQPIDGVVRASLSVKTHLTAYRIPRDNWEGSGQRIRKGAKVWSGKAPNIDLSMDPAVNVLGVSDPLSPHAPKDVDTGMHQKRLRVIRRRMKARKGG